MSNLWHHGVSRVILEKVRARPHLEHAHTHLLSTMLRMMEEIASGGAGLNGTYSELCQSLPVDLLRPCLIRQMEVIYDILASYYVMAQWHKDCLKQQEDAAAAGAGALLMAVLPGCGLVSRFARVIGL